MSSPVEILAGAIEALTAIVADRIAELQPLGPDAPKAEFDAKLHQVQEAAETCDQVKAVLEGIVKREIA